jgi:hypothetical protein
MMYGFGQGQGNRGGAGFDFRGNSPPWPYVGRGRGGLPRCQYPGLAKTALTPPQTTLTREEELGLLKSQAEDTKRHLEDMERRIQEIAQKGSK